MLQKHWMLSWISLAGERIEGSPKGHTPPWHKCVLTIRKSDKTFNCFFLPLNVADSWMQSRTFSLKTWENCTNAFGKKKRERRRRKNSNKGRPFPPFGGSPPFRTAIKKKRKEKGLTSLLLRSYLNLNPERSGSKPPTVCGHRKAGFWSLNEASPSVSH